MDFMYLYPDDKILHFFLLCKCSAFYNFFPFFLYFIFLILIFHLLSCILFLSFKNICVHLYVYVCDTKGQRLEIICTPYWLGSWLSTLTNSLFRLLSFRLALLPWHGTKVYIKGNKSKIQVAERACEFMHVLSISKIKV